MHRDRIGGNRLGEPEIEQFGHVVNAAPLGRKNIARLDVAMNQPVAVRLGQRVAGLHQQMNGPRRGNRPVLFDQLVQAQPGQVFHHVIERAVVGASVVEDFDRVPVRQLGGGAHFAFEAGQRLLVGGFARADELDGHGPLHHLVFGQKDLAHAAGADGANQAVLPQLPGFERLDAQRIDDVRPVNAAHERNGQHDGHVDGKQSIIGQRFADRPERQRQVSR